MSATKEAFMDLQEEVCEKLESLGAPKEVINEFGEIFQGTELGDFAENMAVYAMGIFFLSKTTGYTTERLWNIWKECVEDLADDFADTDINYSMLREEWESFKATTYEKDW